MIPPGWPFKDFPSLVDYYADTVNALFSDWWLLPDPGTFTAPVSNVRQSAHLLTQKTRLNPGSSTGPIVADTALGAITTVQDYLAQQNGAAIDTFKQLYADRLDVVASGQAAAARMLYVSLAGEKETWVRARQNVADLAGQAVGAMRKARGAEGPGFGVVLDVVGAAVLIAAGVLTIDAPVAGAGAGRWA